MNTASPRIEAAPRVGEISTIAPAKINLALHVTGRRADGYHDIETLVVFARFGDRLSVAPAAADSFLVSGRYAADVPMDGANLVVKARDALRAAAGHGATPVAISLEKNLPVASGVGGGSSDAAATLHALSAIWGLEFDKAEMMRIALSLGADLPMCLSARPLLARGIGADIEPVAGLPPLGIVLVNPGGAVSTAEVFGRLERTDNGRLPPLPQDTSIGALRGWLKSTRNDLEPPARGIQPGIDAALAALKQTAPLFARMSGSGATCFGLYDTGNAAKRAAALIRGRHPQWFVAATRSTSQEADPHGPY